MLWLAALAVQAAPYTTATYYVNDASGSPLVAMNQAGAVIWRKSYAPYGKASGNDGDNRIGYTGHVEDPNGLVDAGALIYDPALGIFYSDDPIRFREDNTQSFGRNTYCNGNPYKYVDPDGRVVETVWDVANIVMDVSSMGMNIAAGNYGGAAVDAAGLLIDGAAAVISFVPGGAGAAIKAARGAEKLADGAKGAAHGNKIDDRPATLYEKYDKDGNFLKHGITKHEDPTKRYTAKQIDGGTVVRTDRGPRREMIKKERDLVERSPRPNNREPWAGKRL